MSEILSADLDALAVLAAALAQIASSLNSASVGIDVVMPGSPVSVASRQSGIAAVSGYKFVGRNIGAMGMMAQTSALTYDDVDRGFAAQLAIYTNGVG